MVDIYALSHLNATFSAKVRNFVKKSDLDTVIISDQFIVFYKPTGASFEKQANLEADEINPSQVISLSNIIGDGIEDVITVTIPATNVLKDGELMTITATTNFNTTNKSITIVDAAKFTYKLGSGVGSTSSESTGTVTTQGEKRVVYQNTNPESTIFDEKGWWEFAVRIALSNGDGFTTRERAGFWVQ